MQSKLKNIPGFQGSIGKRFRLKSYNYQKFNKLKEDLLKIKCFSNLLMLLPTKLKDGTISKTSEKLLLSLNAESFKFSIFIKN